MDLGNEKVQENEDTEITASDTITDIAAANKKKNKKLNKKKNKVKREVIKEWQTRCLSPSYYTTMNIDS